MSDPLPGRAPYLRASGAQGVREYSAVHDGDGTIRIRTFFAGENQMGIYFQAWDVPPGATEGRHTHSSDAAGDDFEEFYYVISGQATALFDNEEVVLGPGDALLVPPDVDHGLANRSAEPLRIMIVFGSPARRPDQARDG